MTPGEFEDYVEGWKAAEKRLDRRTARICMVLANINRDPKKRTKPFTEDDFMPRPARSRTMTPEEMLAMVRGLNKAFGGTGG